MQKLFMYMCKYIWSVSYSFFVILTIIALIMFLSIIYWIILYPFLTKVNILATLKIQMLRDKGKRFF